jgi:hypothetical protein
MRIPSILRHVLPVLCVALAGRAMTAQNSIKLFAPVNVRPAPAGWNTVTFNSNTLNLSCPATPITAMLSSSTDSSGYVLADRLIDFTVTKGTTSVGPVNACTFEKSEDTPGAVWGTCFTSKFQASAATLVGQDPDTFVSTGGVAPMNISRYLQPGPVQINVSVLNKGGYIAGSTLYLNTNCTPLGVTGQANLTGNSISQQNPTPGQLTQNFAFNPTAQQQVQFVYDLSKAQAAGSLTITPETIPGTQALPIDPATFQSKYLAETSFATSSCLIHTGELVQESGQLVPACALFTLVCSIGTGSTATGAQCPVSSMPNELFKDIFDGPEFNLPDLATPSGTFHQGVGFLMASEGWTGNPCTFDPASGLQDLPCPQNLVTNFSGPGQFAMTGGTSHPNSTFIAIAQVPEDLTTVTVAGQQPAGWIHTRSASITLSSAPPNLKGSTVPGAASFIASPILSITYGIAPADQPALPSAPPATDTTVENNITCPVASNPLDPLAAVFKPAQQTITVSADGNYLLHYFAQDCAGTRELSFTKNATGSWSTNYYTVPVNVDTVAPLVATGPSLTPTPNPASPYTVGQHVQATYSCTDERSGLVQCGSSTFPYTAALLNSGIITSPVNTSTPGTKTYTVTAMDAAGNQSSASVSYAVVPAYDAAIHFSLERSTIVYPQRAEAYIRITPKVGDDPMGYVQIYDGTSILQTARVRNDGRLHLRLRRMAVGVHQLSVFYSGDRFNPGGHSAPVTLTVLPRH